MGVLRHFFQRLFIQEQNNITVVYLGNKGYVLETDEQLKAAEAILPKIFLCIAVPILMLTLHFFFDHANIFYFVFPAVAAVVLHSSIISNFKSKHNLREAKVHNLISFSNDYFKGKTPWKFRILCFLTFVSVLINILGSYYTYRVFLVNKIMFVLPLVFLCMSLFSSFFFMRLLWRYKKDKSL